MIGGLLRALASSRGQKPSAALTRSPRTPSPQYLDSQSVRAFPQQGDERHWDDYMNLVGAQRIDQLVSGPSFENADYIWPERKMVIELKNIYRELSDNDDFRDEIITVSNSKLDDDELGARIDSLIRKYMARPLKKANAQLKSTRSALRLNNYKGAVVLVNSGFETLPAEAAYRILYDLTKSRDRYKSIHGILYVQDHGASSPYDLGVIGNPRTSDSVRESLFQLARGWGEYTIRPEIHFMGGDLKMIFGGDWRHIACCGMASITVTIQETHQQTRVT